MPASTEEEDDAADSSVAGEGDAQTYDSLEAWSNSDEKEATEEDFPNEPFNGIV